MRSDLPWLNGWYRMGKSAVLMGTMVRCVGCGRSFGITSVVIDDRWTPPTKDPDWPFPEGECPVCADGAPYSHSGPVYDVTVSEIRPGQEWLLEGSWVRVVRVLARGPAERVSVTYEQDGEQDTTREYRGYERAAVR